MLKPRRPSPAMVVACVALAITLSGVGYAAALARNSVGSAQVKPNSLNGTDIKESTLKGVVLGNGTASAGNKVLGTGTAFVTGFTIPNTGRFEVDCNGGTTNHRFRNTTGSDAEVWLERGDPAAPLNFTVAPGNSDGVTSSTAATLGTRLLVHPHRRSGRPADRGSGREPRLRRRVLRPVRLGPRHALATLVGECREGRVRQRPPRVPPESGARVKGLILGSWPTVHLAPGQGGSAGVSRKFGGAEPDSSAKLRCRERRDGRVVRQRPAKPRTPVRIRFAPYAVAPRGGTAPERYGAPAATDACGTTNADAVRSSGTRARRPKRIGEVRLHSASSDCYVHDRPGATYRLRTRASR